MSQCARPGCGAATKSFCSGCLIEHYCGSNCQKLDWKSHKSMCPMLKKLTKELLPDKDFVEVVIDMVASNKGSDIRFLEHLLSFIDHQLGNLSIGKDCCVMEDRHQVAFNVAILLNLTEIYFRLATIYRLNDSISTKDCNDKAYPYYKKLLRLLNPWLIQIYSISDSSNRTNVFQDSEKSFLFVKLCSAERGMALVSINRKQFDVAEDHCKRNLNYSKKFGCDGKFKTTSIFTALKFYVQLRGIQGDILGAISFAEEAYNLVVVAYDLSHLEVQEAANLLIKCLISNNDLFNAERFAEMTYGILKDQKNGIDQEGEEIAEASYNLADLILQQNGDLIKAEGLIRESLRIIEKLGGMNSFPVHRTALMMARILQAQGNLGDETKELYDRCLAITITQHGPDAEIVPSAYITISRYHHELSKIQITVDRRREQLLIAKNYLEDALRVSSKIHTKVEHPENIRIIGLFAKLSLELADA